ncbi:MAG: proprotein convertase P-domain-containing protein [Chloroflexota bacterium]
MRALRSLALVAAVAALATAAPVSAATTTRTSGNRNLPIVDRRATSSAIKVTTAGAIKDVNVSVRLDHAAVGDLDLYLVSPSGIVVQLSTNNGSGADWGTGADDCTGAATVFDDEAPHPIYQASAPFSGSWQPEQPLSTLDGKSQKGVWRLIVGDNTANGQGGTLYCWKLRITV